MIENESLSVTLTLENDEELECDVLTIFETDSRQYIALLSRSMPMKTARTDRSICTV